MTILGARARAFVLGATLLLALVLTGTAPAQAQSRPLATEATCFAGAYALSDGSKVTIAPSDLPNLRYRFADGRVGKLFPTAEGGYESGPGWSGRSPVILKVSFLGSCGDGGMRFQREGGPDLAGERVPLKVTPVSFRSGDEILYGELVSPASGRPKAVVVLQYGGSRESAVANNYVQWLLPLDDIAVFVFDKRGTGRSTGRFTIEIPVLADDMAAAVAAVRARPEAAGLPLGLMGESQGGWVAPLTATKTGVDFVVVGYGLAISMEAEDREEVAQDLRARGFGPDVLAKGEALHAAATRVMNSRFAEGLEALEGLKARWRGEPWFAGLQGDYTGPLATTPAEGMAAVRKVFDFPYDLTYDPAPALKALDVPTLWVLAGRDTEAPHESTLAIVKQLQTDGAPIDLALFPNAEHGMIEMTPGPQGPILGDRLSAGYHELLADWMLTRRMQGVHGDAVQTPRRR